MEHLQKYPVMLEAIMRETVEGNPDRDYLNEAIHALRNLQTSSQLLTFQSSMGKGAAGKLQWYDLVAEDIRSSIPKAEAKRQS
jgi:RHO1 GDP-GTP exchange protein 1/2